MPIPGTSSIRRLEKNMAAAAMHLAPADLTRAFGMTIGTGLKSALNASVFSAAAGAFALSLLDPGSWCLDRLRRDNHRESGESGR